MSALPAGVAKDAPTPVASGESRRPLSIVLIQTGSRGDVQPFCLLGQALHAAGHSVAIAAEARHEAYVRSFGLAFRLIAGDCNAWQTEAALVQKSHAGAGGVMAFLALLKDYRHRAAPVEAFLASIASAAEGADLIVSGALNAAEATCAAEATGAAFAFVGLIPWLSYTSDYGLPIVSPALLSCRWSRTFNRLVWDTVIQSGWRDLAAHVNAWRVGSLGLPTCTHPGGPFTELVEPQSKSPRAPATVITAGSALLCIDGRPASDWGAKWPLVGPFLAPLPAEPPPAALEAFLQDAGADARPVVYLGFGSMRNPRPAALASLIIAACTAGGVRGILVEGWSDLGSEASQAILRPAVTARTILVVKEVSHTWLFPRVAAIVHHCGVGTANAALASGAPQVGRRRTCLIVGLTSLCSTLWPYPSALCPSDPRPAPAGPATQRIAHHQAGVRPLHPADRQPHCGEPRRGPAPRGAPRARAVCPARCSWPRSRDHQPRGCGVAALRR